MIHTSSMAGSAAIREPPIHVAYCCCSGKSSTLAPRLEGMMRLSSICRRVSMPGKSVFPPDMTMFEQAARRTVGSASLSVRHTCLWMPGQLQPNISGRNMPSPAYMRSALSVICLPFGRLYVRSYKSMSFAKRKSAGKSSETKQSFSLISFAITFKSSPSHSENLPSILAMYLVTSFPA